ncbi:MAG: hypothetical protein GY869_11380 [Planctomycetes bacterium]|nr:hypothetical protein [Planctomycetota bacterium]
MQITSTVSTRVCTHPSLDKKERKFAPIHAGTKGYNFDMTNKALADQLVALRDANIIKVDCPLPGDKDWVGRDKKKKMKPIIKEDKKPKKEDK